MKFFTVFKNIVLLFFLFNSYAFSNNDLQKVSIQLQWLDQFQFAGYYVAKEKGFYKDAGLDVEIKKYNYGINPVDEVLNKKATFAVGRSSLLIDKSKGKDIMLLKAIFQSSPLMLLATKNSNIRSINDFLAKKIMITPDASDSADIYAMLNQKGIKLNDLDILKHSFNIDDLINNKTDLMASYVSNEPFLLEQKGVEYNIFHPKDHGFDFYSDFIFTSSYELKSNKQRVDKFIQASLKGWRYAFENIDEAVQLILSKYNTQNKTKEALKFEAVKLKELAYYKNNTLGDINIDKLQRIYDIYNVMGLIKKQYDIESIVSSSCLNDPLFTEKEKQYLKNKKELSICVQPDWLPYEGIDNGKYIGISADYLNIISKKLNLPLKVVTANTNLEVIEMLQKGTCDIKPIARKGRGKLPYKTTSYNILDYIALVTKIDEPFINNLNEHLDKTFVVVNGRTRFIKKVKKLYPKIKTIEVDSIDQAFELIFDGKAYGMIGKSLHLLHHIHNYYPSKLKVMNEFDTIKTGIGVNEKDPVLHSIMQKALSLVDEKEKLKIKNQWTTIYVDRKQDYTYVWYALAIVGIVVFLMFYRQYILRKINLSLEKRIKEKTAKLEEFNKTLENKVEEKTSELNSIIDNIPSMIFIKDAKNLNFIKLNKAGENILSIKEKEILGKSDYDFFTQKDKETIENGKTLNIDEEVIDTPNGTKILRTKKVVVFDKQKKPLYLLGISDDITEKKDQDRILLEQSKNAAMGEMIGNIAHQWRQPLSVISTGATGLKIGKEYNTLTDEQFVQMCDTINNNAQYLSKTIDDFKNFIKNERKLTKFDLSENINSFLTLVESSFKNNDILLVKELENSIEVSGYYNELIQCYMNIFNNSKDALKDSKLKERIFFIETKKTNDKVMIKFKDNVGGIPEKIMPHIFEPYFTTKHQSQGTGLGLSMTYNLITEGMKGEISVKNVTYEYEKEEYIGALFTIVLPVK